MTTHDKDQLVVSSSRTSGDIGLVLPDTRIVGHAQPADLVADGVNERTLGSTVVGVGAELILLDKLVEKGRIAVHRVPCVIGVDVELVRKKRVV